MARIADVGGFRLVIPAGAAEEERLVRHAARRIQKEPLHTRFAIRQPVAEKTEIGFEACIRGRRKMRVGTERIVDGDAVAGAERAIGIGDRIAPTIGQDKVEIGQAPAQGVMGHLGDFSQCCRGIDVPEDLERIRAGCGHDLRQKKIVLKADAARLDDDISLRGERRDMLERGQAAFIDHDRAPVGRADIAMLLPIVDVRLEKGDVVAVPRQRSQKAPIVGGGTIPVG